jgi:hypothetical protein
LGEREDLEESIRPESRGYLSSFEELNALSIFVSQSVLFECEEQPMTATKQ